MKTHGTAVAFYRRPDGRLSGYRAEGHTGYAESGYDIVCSAVSALTQTTLNGLNNVLHAPVMYEVDDDTAFIEVKLTPEATDEQIGQAQILLETLRQGLQAIERSYPRNVRIFFEERR